MILSRIYLHLGGIALVPGFLLSLVTGCASFRQIEIPPLPENLPASHELTAVPFFPQEEYQCGPAALAMAISWSGLPARPEDLVEEVYTPSRKGSLQVAIIATARRHGRLAYEISDLESLFPEIAAGYPVIMFLIGGPVHSVLAAIIETETVMDSAREQEAREYLHQLPTRKDLQDAFIAQGIDPIEVRAELTAWILLFSETRGLYSYLFAIFWVFL